MIRTFIALVLLTFAVPGVPGEQPDTVSAARAMVNAINQRDLEGLDAWVAADVVRHSAATPGVVVTNIDEFRAFLEQDFASVPDSVMEIELIFGSGPYVAMRARYSGPQAGQMGPFPPTGERFEIPFIGILRFADGKIAEIWVEWDNLSALTQLGHFNPPNP